MPNGAYNDHFLYVEGVILAGFGRKNANILPEEPPETQFGGSTATNTKTTAMLGNLAGLNAYNRVSTPQLGLISGKIYLFATFLALRV